MARIVILGCAGTGKTTLARRLARHMGVPVIILDELWWEHGEDLASFRSDTERLHAGGAWVSDGNFASATFLIRLPRATQIVWLEKPRLLCALRVIARVFRHDSDHHWRQLPSVLRFIWHFERVNRPRIERLRRKLGSDVPVIHLSGEAEIDAFLLSLPKRAAKAAA